MRNDIKQKKNEKLLDKIQKKPTEPTGGKKLRENFKKIF